MDTRRIVTRAADGTPTTLLDFSDETTFFSVENTLTFVPADRKTVMAQRSRRYGGATATAESHGNGAVKWISLVKAATSDLLNAAVESALSVVEFARLDLYFQFKPENATDSVFFPIRGPAKWQSDYKQKQYLGAGSMAVQFELPVAPLPHGAVSTQSISSTTFPLHKTDLTSIPGDAPALCDVAIRASGGSAAPLWALIAWWKRPGSPLASSVAPAGILEAESGTPATWSASGTYTGYRGTAGVKVTTSGAGTASDVFVVDPSTMAQDDFTQGTIDIEVWARVELNAGVVSPRLTLSLAPNAGAGFGAEQFSQEFRSVGKQLVLPASGTVFRLVRVGTITMPIDPAAPLKWNLKVGASWAAGSAGVFGLDYVACVPVRQRACGVTGVANDSAYPKFIASTSDTTKTIRSDLSGKVGSGAGNQGRDSGLGGSPIELPPGNVDMLFLLSSTVPDDPTVDTTSMQLSHTSTTALLSITERRWLVK